MATTSYCKSLEFGQRAQRFFLIGRDMTASKLASEKLIELAHFDQLTKLPNRTSFVGDFSAFMADEAGRPFALRPRLLRQLL